MQCKAASLVHAFQSGIRSTQRPDGAGHLNTDKALFDQCDVLVCGDDPEARKTVVQLSEELGMRA